MKDVLKIMRLIKKGVTGDSTHVHMSMTDADYMVTLTAETFFEGKLFQKSHMFVLDQLDSLKLSEQEIAEIFVSDMNKEIQQKLDTKPI